MECKTKVNYIRINHKNRIDYFTEEKLVQFKIDLFAKLSSMQEKDFSYNLNTFTEKFIPNFTDDILEINNRLTKKFYDNNPNIKYDRKCPEMLIIMDKILNHNFNMEFKCNELFVNIISRILYFSFREIKTNPKLYNIKNFSDLKTKIADIIYNEICLEDYVIISKEQSKADSKNSKQQSNIVHSFMDADAEADQKIFRGLENKNQAYKGHIKTQTKTNSAIKNIEFSQSIAQNNTKENTPNKTYPTNTINSTPQHSSQYFNDTDNSNKSSFRSNNDSNHTINKKSTFSSTTNNNNLTINSTKNNDELRDGLIKDENNSPNDNALKSAIYPSYIIEEKSELNNLTKFNPEINQMPTNKLKLKVNEKGTKDEYKSDSFKQMLSTKPKNGKRFSYEQLKSKSTVARIITQINFHHQINKKYIQTVLETNTSEGGCNMLLDNKLNLELNSKADKKNTSYNNNNLTRKISKSTNCKVKSKHSLNFSNASDFFKFNFSHIVHSKKNVFVEYKKEEEFYSYGIPIYLILLVQKLLTVKKITITIPRSYIEARKESTSSLNGSEKTHKDNMIDNYAIVLLNIEWLFQNLLEIDIDFGVGSKSRFDKLFKVKYSKEISHIVYGKKFRNMVDKYKESFELLLLICSLCSKLNCLYIFSLNNYSCYYFELDYITRTYHKELQVIHILDIFNNYVNLIKLNINFNALDSFTFERIINLIHINNNLKCINFDFRINGEDFSIDSLKRIYLKHYLYSSALYDNAGSIINKPDFTSEAPSISTYYIPNPTSYLQSLYNNGINFLKKNSTDSNNSVDVIKQTENAYQSNNFTSFIGVGETYSGRKNSMSSNSEALDSKKNQISINASTTASFIGSNDLINSEFKNAPDFEKVINFLQEENENKYLSLIMRKFEPLLEELFLIIESKKNLVELNFNINLPNLITSNDNFIMTLQKFIFNIFKILDTQEIKMNTIKIKSPYLSFDNRKYPVIEKIINTININNNNSSINNFTLDIQINKIPNLINLIPKNVQFLSLGELDVETFSILKKKFFETDAFLNSILNSFTISFSASILEKCFLINEIKYIYGCAKPKTLKEIQILTNLIINKNSLKEILFSIKDNNIEKYYFEFNKQSLENFKYFRSNLQKISLQEDRVKIYEEKINYFFNLINKYHPIIDNNISRKVIYNIINFVTPIYLTNIEIKFRD